MFPKLFLTLKTFASLFSDAMNTKLIFIVFLYFSFLYFKIVGLIAKGSARLLCSSSFNREFFSKPVKHFRELRKIQIEARECDLGHDLHYVLLLYLSRSFPSLPAFLSLPLILISIYLSPFDSSFIMSAHGNLTSYVVVIAHEYLTYAPCLTAATHTGM